MMSRIAARLTTLGWSRHMPCSSSTGGPEPPCTVTMRAPEVFISVRVNPSKSMDPRSNDVPDQLGCHPGRLASASRSGTQVSRHCRLTLAIVQFTQGVLGPGSRAARSAGMTGERIVLIIRPVHQRSAEEAARLEAGEVAGVVEREAALGPVDANAGLEILPTGR